MRDDICAPPAPLAMSGIGETAFHAEIAEVRSSIGAQRYVETRRTNHTLVVTSGHSTGILFLMELHSREYASAKYLDRTDIRGYVQFPKKVDL